MRRFPVVALGFAALLTLSQAAQSAEVTVMISGGMSQAYTELVAAFERQTENKVITLRGPSMGTTQNAIPLRLARGEGADVLIMVGYALGDLIKQGKVVPDSRVDIARSLVGVAVKAGAPKPDISTLEAFKRTLLAAKSVAYSDSASGVYIENEMYKKLGIEAEMKPKSHMIPADPVGGVVAKGEAELGFQQIAELKPIAGIEIIGVMPPEVQIVTIYAAGVVVGAKEPAAGKALIDFLASPKSAPVLIKTGLEPINGAK